MINKIELSKTLTELNPWWEDSQFRFNIIPRSSFSFLNKRLSNVIDIFIGARRVGKTSIMQGIINNLLDSGVKNYQIVYFVTDARISKELTPEDIVRFLREKFKLSLNKKVYFFLDEVQDMQGWQRGVKYLYDNSKIKFYITGSSSLVLRAETSKLTGRFILHEVLGLSFEEYLEFTKRKVYKSQSRNIDLVVEYLETGGYPEYVLNRDKQVLANIIESTLYRDLISQYGIRNPAFLKELLDYLADKVTNNVSCQNIARDLKVNDETAKFYLKYLQDVYLIYPLFRKSKSHRISKSSVPKYYFNDTGVINLRTISSKIGSLAENAVYLHLRRKSFSKEHPDIFYNEVNGVKVDFDSRHGNPIEVKFRDNLTKGDLEKYQLAEEKITFIVKKQSDLLHDILPMHSKITLDSFLLSKKA
jgi:uncharacterized protein